MKTLDRYISKNFISGYLIVLAVMIGMFVGIDLFLNVDEFATHADMGLMTVLGNIASYYGIRCVLWFRDLGGMIIVIAAVFSLARLTRNNELIAIMASGVSLKRVLAPILLLALLLNGLLIVDQEVVIPRLAGELTRRHDQLPGQASYDVWFLGDANGSLVSCQRYEEKEQIMERPLIVLRSGDEEGTWRVTGQIQADRAIYDTPRSGWILENGQRLGVPQADPGEPGFQDIQTVEFYATDLGPQELRLRRREGFKGLLSMRQLMELEQTPGIRRTEQAEIALQKHTRVTMPIINMIMLMVALPVLICRDPRNMKTAILISFSTTAACFTVAFLCALFATEVFFGQLRPALFSWLPIFIFFPIALLQIDGMRT